MAQDHSHWSPVRRLVEMLKIDRRDIYYLFIFGLFSGIITLSLPLGIQAIIGLIGGGAMSASLVVLITVVTLGILMGGVFTLMQLTITENLQRRIFARSSLDFAFRIPHLLLEHTTTEYAPELVNRFFDTLTLQKGLPKLLIDYTSSVLQIAFGLILIAFYHPFFGFFGVVLVIFLVAIFRFTGPYGLKTSIEESKYKYAVVYWLEEVARAIYTFKQSSNLPLPMRETDKLTSRYLDSKRKHFRVLINQYGFMLAFKTLIVAALLYLGSYLVINNQINIGQFVAAEIVIILVVASIEKLILNMETVYDVLTALDKIGHVHDLPLESHSGIDFAACDTPTKGMSVRLQEVGFTYPDSANASFSGFNLSIGAGERVCISGYNGAGRTTLVQLMSGLFTTYQGIISFNDLSLRNIDLSSIRKYIAVYNSMEDIFRGTVLENIRMGDESITISQIIEQAKETGLHEHIQRLPDGYYSKLLPGGSNVSKGLRTRIILTRCIIEKPRLFILGNVLQSLDDAEQIRLSNYLTDKRHPWTLVVLSNNAYLASLCDRTLIMKNGNIIAEGTYDEMRVNTHFQHVCRNIPTATI